MKDSKNKARGWLYTRALIKINRAERSALLEEINQDYYDRHAITSEERADLLVAVVMSNTMAEATEIVAQHRKWRNP